jgi:hypothetical protein
MRTRPWLPSPLHVQGAALAYTGRLLRLRGWGGAAADSRKDRPPGARWAGGPRARRALTTSSGRARAPPRPLPAARLSSRVKQLLVASATTASSEQSTADFPVLVAGKLPSTLHCPARHGAAAQAAARTTASSRRGAGRVPAAGIAACEQGRRRRGRHGGRLRARGCGPSVPGGDARHEPPRGPRKHQSNHVAQLKGTKALQALWRR